MNVFQALSKWNKSKPIVDEIEKEANNMNSNNWRTNLHGIALGALMLAAIWAPSKFQEPISKTFDALVVTGFLTAADGANFKR